MTEQQINMAANLHRINSEFKGSAADFAAGAEWASMALQGEKLNILAKIALLAERIDNGADRKEVAAEMRNININNMNDVNRKMETAALMAALEELSDSSNDAGTLLDIAMAAERRLRLGLISETDADAAFAKVKHALAELEKQQHNK